MNEQLIPVCERPAPTRRPSACGSMRAGPSPTASPGVLAIVVGVHSGCSTDVEPASRIGLRDELLHYPKALKAA